MNSFANCIHRMQGIESRFQRVAQRNIARFKGAATPMRYTTATIYAITQTIEMPRCWRKAEEALQ